MDRISGNVETDQFGQGKMIKTFLKDKKPYMTFLLNEE